MASVSIVVPCYNAAPTIGETLRCALEQVGVGDEVIVVDDGSTDGSWEILREFGERIVAVRQENAGASAARDRGTSMAHGEFIQYLDADDLLAPGAIRRKVAVAEATGADLVYTDWQRFRDLADGRREWSAVVSREITEVDPDAELAAFGDFWCPPVALLYRRILVDRIGGWHADLPIIQDARFLQDAVMLGAKLVRVPEVLAFYREPRPGSLSQRGALRFKRDVLINACAIEDRWRAKGELTERRSECLGRLYQEMAQWFFWQDASLFGLSVSRMRGINSNLRPGWEKFGEILASLFGIRTARALLAPARSIRDVFRSISGGIESQRRDQRCTSTH